MGQRLDDAINDLGRKQVRKTAADLKKEKIDIIFSSPLLRAKGTAEIVGKESGVKIFFDDRLKERDYGDISGKTWEEAQDFSKANYDMRLVDRQQKYDYRPWNGESAEQVKTRLLDFVADVKKDHPDKTPLVVTHGGILRILHHIYGKTKELPELLNSSIHEFDL